MGNDGGSFQARSDLVKEKAKEIKIDNNITAKFRAKLCCLSKARLKRPIAVCKAGNLYNKEEVIKALLEKSIPLSFAHIKRIKDIKDVKLESNPDKKSEYPFICPLSQIEFNGLNRFVALWSCGCVFSQQLLKKLDDKNSNNSLLTCPVCNHSYTNSDVISLNSTPQEIEAKRSELLTEMANKEKKHRHHEITETDDKISTLEPKLKKKVKSDKEKPSNNVATAPIIGTHKIALIEKLTQTQLESESFKSLFHNDEDMKKKDENLFTRNVRFGIR